jgi:hypothetical protein
VVGDGIVEEVVDFGSGHGGDDRSGSLLSHGAREVVVCVCVCVWNWSVAEVTPKTETPCKPKLTYGGGGGAWLKRNTLSLICARLHANAAYRSAGFSSLAHAPRDNLEHNPMSAHKTSSPPLKPPQHPTLECFKHFIVSSASQSHSTKLHKEVFHHASCTRVDRPLLFSLDTSSIVHCGVRHRKAENYAFREVTGRTAAFHSLGPWNMEIYAGIWKSADACAACGP